MKLVKSILSNTLKNAYKTILFILKIIIPVTFVVKLLQYLDLLEPITYLFEPLMGYLGLPGSSALVLVSANLINIYAGLAIMSTLSFTIKETTILAVMILFSHSLIIESSIIKGLKVPIKRQLILRISAAILAGLLLNIFIGNHYSNLTKTNLKTIEEIPVFSINTIQQFWMWLKAFMLDYTTSMLKTALEISIIITLVLLGLELLKQIKIINLLNRIVYHFTKYLGFSEKSTLSLLVGFFIGITYGAGTILVEYKEGNLSKTDVTLVTTFLLLCHSIFEDVILFVRQGAVLWILLLYKLSFTIIIVFIYNLIRQLKFKKNKLKQLNAQ